MPCFAVVLIVAVVASGCGSLDAAAVGEDQLGSDPSTPGRRPLAGRQLSTTGDNAPQREYYADYETPAPPSLMECTELLTKEVANWSVPYQQANFNDTFQNLLIHFIKTSSSACFSNHAHGTTELVMYADLTWVYASQQQMLSVFLAENPQITVDFHEKFFFQSLADIAVEPIANAPNAWYISDADSQASEYSGSLQSSLWSGPLYAVDNAAALLTTRPVGLLFPRTNLLLLYRRDVFEALNLAVPATWVDLITTATALKGTNFTDSGPGGGYGICLDLGKSCKSNFFVMAIAGSLIQSQGLHQGLYIDPVTKQPLANNAAMVEAFRIFAALADQSNPESQDACTGWNEYWQQGRCAMTIEWDFSLRWAAQDASKVKGRLGVSLLPGSAQVLDRPSGLLLPCTASLCPHATMEFVQAPQSSASPASLAPAATTAALVNRMPFSTMCEVATGIYQTQGTLSATAPVQVALLTFLNSYLNPPIQFMNTRQLISNLAYDGLLGATPRYDAPPAFNVSSQVRHNFNATDLHKYYPVLWAARYHPNAGGDIACPGNVLIRVAIEEALHNVTKLFQDAVVVVPVMSARYGLVIASLNVTDAEFFTSYSRTINYVPPPPSALSMGAAPRSEITTVVATVVCVGGLLLVLLVGLVVFQLRMRRRTLLGKVTAPGCGEDTTLLCTDIQNSTLLWETMEAAIMDEAINTHHALLRKCMNRRGGYLSACEGDSFIIAFHHPRAAVLFAIDAQTELMQAKWSPKLLAAPDCVPVWALTKRDEPSSSLRPASSSGVPALSASNGGGGGACRSSSKSLVLGPLHGVTAARSQAASLGRHLASMLLHRPLLRRWGSTDQTFVGTTNINTQVTNWSKSLGLCATPAFGGAASMHGGSPTLGGMGGGGANSHVYGPSSDSQVNITSAGDRPSAAARAVARQSGPVGQATQPAWMMFNPMHRTPSMTDVSSPDLMLLEQGLTQRLGSAPCMERKSNSVPRVPRTAPTMSRLERLSAAAVRQVRRPPAGALALAEGLELPTTAMLRDYALCRMAIEMGSTPPTAVFASPQLGGRPLSLLQIPSFGCDRAGGGPTVAILTREAPRRSSAHELGQLDMPTSQLGQPALTFPFLSSALATGSGAPDVSSSAGSPLPLSAMSPTTGRHNVHLMAALLAPGSSPITWQDLMRSGVETASRSDSGVINSPGSRNARVPTLTYNGLRVRMGMYSGIASSGDIVYNRAAGNVQYSGDAMEGAKAICSAAHGGMVLMAGETYRRLLPSQVMRHALLVYAGDFHLDDIRRTWQVYQAALVCLPQRMALSEPVRCVKQLQLGTCSAPVGYVTIAFMYVVGATTLLNEVPEEGRRALAICHAAVTEELLRWGGYLVEAVDGLVLAAFGNTCSAACWGLACQQQMLRQPWSAELLAQECCEEVFTVEQVSSMPRDTAGLVQSHCATASFTSFTAGGAARSGRRMSTVPGVRSTLDGMPPFNAITPLPTRRRVLLRGLRLKVGLDVGNPTPDLNPDSGRMAYRGRVMNRAARIASKASAGRVVCSSGAWDNMLDTPSPALAANDTMPVTAESLGMFELKGLIGSLELFDCHHEVPEADDGWDGPDDGLNAPPPEFTLDEIQAALQRIELRQSHLAEVRRASFEMHQASLHRASLPSKAMAD